MIILFKISTLLITITLSACATNRPTVSLGLGQITCPASALEDLNAPPTMDRQLLSQMSEEASREVANREAWWDSILASARQIQVDTLNLCRDVNNAAASATNIR